VGAAATTDLGTERVVITGGLEPAYEIGGDFFNYAINGGLVDLLVIDAVGHGLPAAAVATVAIGAYRHARRNRLDLPDLAVEINTAISSQLGASQFTTAVLARLDLDTGRLRWINAGHPKPLIVRGSPLVQPPHCPPSRPLGLQERKPVCCETRLEPGDRLVLYTDGVTEARSPTGDFFGRGAARRLHQRRRRGGRPRTGNRAAPDAPRPPPSGRPAPGRRQHRGPGVAYRRRTPGASVIQHQQLSEGLQAGVGLRWKELLVDALLDSQVGILPAP